MVSKRSIQSAELLSIGSELTVGDTRDTNAGELARRLTGLGIEVRRIQALPDGLDTIADAFAGGLERADLVISTGGLGPTPDDLTRESIASLAGETPVVDPGLEAWLREMWNRRGMPFPDLNLKQAWLIPSATALPNPNGTAPGWWVDRPDGRVIVALPGPPREMRPMWSDEVLPRLRERGAGADVATRTFRLAGVGESQVADMLGERLTRDRNPLLATYARAEAVDVRVSAVPEPALDGRSGRSAAELVDEMAREVLEVLGEHVWAEGETTWAEAIGAALEAGGRTLAVAEVGTGGSLAALLGDRPWLRVAEGMAADAPTAAMDDEGLARRSMERGAADVGVCVRARPHGADTAVRVTVVLPEAVQTEERMAFLGGAHGRSRAALAAAAVLLAQLRAEGPPPPARDAPAGSA